MNGHKEAPPEMLWGGIIAPAAIVSLVLMNLVIRKVYWPSRGPDPIIVYTNLWPIVGIILIKLGFAGALCSWYLLSNLERTERYGPMLTLACAAVAAAGFVVFLGSVLY
jgi:hypothetical protein